MSVLPIAPVASKHLTYQSYRDKWGTILEQAGEACSNLS